MNAFQHELKTEEKRVAIERMCVWFLKLPGKEQALWLLRGWRRRTAMRLDLTSLNP